MITTSFAYGDSYSKSDSFYEDCEHDDYMSPEDYDARRYQRDGWKDSNFDRQYFWIMIETEFFILTQEEYAKCVNETELLNVSLDYYLMEFCDVEGPYIICEEWDFLKCNTTNINVSQNSNIQVTW